VGSSASNPYNVQISFNNQSHMPLVQQWNIGVQRQLPLLLTLEVNYIGNHALHLSYNLNENVVPLASASAVGLANTSLATQNASPFPNLKQFTVNSNIGSSDYNGLQVTVSRQFNSRLAVLSNYTYSKSLDDGSTIYNFSAPNGTANSQYNVAGPNFIHDWAPSNIDVKHVLNLAMIYTTPGPWWLRNWHISPVVVPIFPAASFNRSASRTESSESIPSKISAAFAALFDCKCPMRWKLSFSRTAQVPVSAARNIFEPNS